MPKASNDPGIQELRNAAAAVVQQLVDLDHDPTVARARAGVLTGTSAAAWAQADAELATAWESYLAVKDLLDRAPVGRTKLSPLLTTTVPGARGPADPMTAMRHSAAAISAATAVVGRLEAAWGALASRTKAAHAAATEAGDEVTARGADALAGLLENDPLAVSPADVEDLEAAAAAARGGRAAAQTAVARLDLDIARARSTLTSLDADLRAGASDLDHAASRIAGFDRAAPVPDFDQLAGWLDRIVTAAGHDRVRSAGMLADWFSAAAARRSELDAALCEARDAMRGRADGRGLWMALRAKAGELQLDEQEDVAAALEAARDELWRAPCDLGVAEAELAKLSELLNRPRGS